MIGRDLRRLIEHAVFSRPSSETLFNPYVDRHPEADRPDAVKIRRANLRRYLDSYTERPPVLIVGEASGPWGCRFSGVPFTSEQQLCCGELPFAGKQSSLHPVPHQERTAQIFWQTMTAFHPRCFIWNAVPLHPHPRGEPFSLRRPDRGDIGAFETLLAGVVECLEPDCLIAVGRIAETALRNIHREPHYVRHPSHGGMKEFRAGMQTILAALP